jgi:hypothetical protein
MVLILVLILVLVLVLIQVLSVCSWSVSLHLFMYSYAGLWQINVFIKSGANLTIKSYFASGVKTYNTNCNYHIVFLKKYYSLN